MAEFFKTIMGRKFFEADVPRFIGYVGRIATALEKLSTPEPGKEVGVVTETYRCEVCGSRNVEIMTWMNANSRVPTDLVEGLSDTSFCNECEEHTTLSMSRTKTVDEMFLTKNRNKE